MIVSFRFLFLQEILQYKNSQGLLLFFSNDLLEWKEKMIVLLANNPISFFSYEEDDEESRDDDYDSLALLFPFFSSGR